MSRVKTRFYNLGNTSDVIGQGVVLLTGEESQDKSVVMFHVSTELAQLIPPPLGCVNQFNRLNNNSFE